MQKGSMNSKKNDDIIRNLKLLMEKQDKVRLSDDIGSLKKTDFIKNKKRVQIIGIVESSPDEDEADILTNEVLKELRERGKVYDSDS
jgi:capsular polysaccharide biosynthesis protein